MMQHYLPVISVSTPLAFSLALILSFRCSDKFIKILAGAGAACTFALVLAMFPSIRNGEVLGNGAGFLALPVQVSFFVDPLSFFFAAIFAFILLFAVIYSFSYSAHSHARGRFFALLLLLEAAMLGVVLTNSLVGLFIFFELMTVSAYLLIVHEEDETAMFAGAKFLYMTVVAGLAIFFGLVVTYYLSGRLDFTPGGYVPASPLAGYALFAFLLGFGIKAGMFPLHIWLPDAHPAAPAPVSALLSGCCIKTGAYGLIRIIHHVYGIELVRMYSLDSVLLVLAVVTILLGSAMALQQDHLKRRLAYSSVAQIGYILLGISLLTERALFGALFHIFSHALMKSALFLCAGAVITQTGRKKVSELAGVGYQMPVVMISFALASLAMVGTPPFVAFISKWHLAVASLETGHLILVFVLIVSSLLNALYYYPVAVNAFFPGKKHGEAKQVFTLDEIPLSMLSTTALLAFFCLFFGLMRPNWPVIMASRIAAMLF